MEQTVQRLILFFFAFWPAFGAPPQKTAYKLAETIQVGGDGGWDYLSADSATRRLFISHTGRVEVFNIDSEKRLGAITGLNRVHGIALAHEFETGFISDGGANEIIAFDLKTLHIKNRIAAGRNPDGIVYDNYSKQIFAFNGQSGDATVISAADGTVMGTIPLGSKPEFPVNDDHGNVFVNMEEANEIIKIDAKQRSVVAHWSLSPCESPSGLAIDKAGQRLFSVCDNKLMAVMDSGTGRIVAKLAIGEGPDAAVYDSGAKLIFSSNGESGTLTIIREVDPDHFTVVQTLPTSRGARTMAIDGQSRKAFLPTADFGAEPPAVPSATHSRRAILPNTFKLLVVVPTP